MFWLITVRLSDNSEPNLYLSVTFSIYFPHNEKGLPSQAVLFICRSAVRSLICYGCRRFTQEAVLFHLDKVQKHSRAVVLINK